MTREPGEQVARAGRKCAKTLDNGFGYGYAASVMKDLPVNPPVSERPATTGSIAAAWLTSSYYWFTNPPAVLEGRTGCMQI